MNTFDEMLANLLIRQLATINDAQNLEKNPNNAAALLTYLEGLTEMATAIAHLREAGQTTLTKAQVDTMLARYELMGREAKNGSD